MAETITDRKVRVGLIGCGGISNAHLDGLAKFEDVELAAFCDIVVERAQKHADKYRPAGHPGAVYDDAAKMFAGTKLDAAYIMIPTYAHGAPERACVAAGVPFLVEKPLGIDPADLRKLVQEVEASGVIATAGFMNRYRDSINKVKALLASDPAILIDGAWIGGPPLRKEGDYFASAPIGLWWPIKEKSGGQFVEQVIHTVDIARYLLGEVVEVHSYAANGFNQKLPNLIQNYSNDDASVVVLKFASGAVGNIMASCSTAGGGGDGVFLNIWCAHHTVRYTGWAHNAKIYKSGEKEPEEISGEVPIFNIEDRAFIDAVKTNDRSKLRCTYADGARTTLVTLAANESLDKHAPVTVQY